MSALSDFYSDAHLGNLFGIKGPDYGPHGHLGVDFNKMPAGTSIPAWRAGRAVKRGLSPTLGNYLIVQTDIGYVGYHHMLSAAFKVPGDGVGLGDIVGRLGMTGTLATGVHLHTTLADSSVVGGFDVHDPLPYVRGTVAASLGQRPLNGNGDGSAPVDPYAQAKTFWRMNMSTAYIKGDSSWIAGKNASGADIPAGSIIYAINTDTGFRRWVSQWGEFLAYCAAAHVDPSAELVNITKPQAYVDAIPKQPGTVDWDGKTVPKAA